jgi:uncharacterized DUF497 family protein
MVEFDENKSAVNKAKHGIDFKTATRLWDDPYRIVIPARVVDEPRYIMIAMLEGACWSAVSTHRNKNIRIISVRRARENEKEIYNQL